MQPSGDPWTSFLDWLTQIITPDWGSLVALLPLGLLGLVALFLAATAYQWYRAAAINRPRVPRRLAAGAPPPGVHLPGPSFWPFVLPVGALLILFALAVRPSGQGGRTDLVNLPVLVAGLAVTALGIAGWFRDSMREWSRTEHGDGHAELAHAATAQGAALPAPPHRLPAAVGGGGPSALVGSPAHKPDESGARELVLPPGVHLPGPSPWPFLAPIGATFIFFGLVFSPAILLGGIVMSLIAVAGWYRDAGSEYRQTEEGHAPEPPTRDPERAFPKRLVPVYGVIAVASLALAAAPAAISFANARPAASPAASPAAGPVADRLTVVAENTAFTVEQFALPAGKPATMEFENRDAAPHNVAIYRASDLKDQLFLGEVFSGPDKRTYQIPPLEAGSYYFLCSVHPNMNGTVSVR